MWKSRGRTARSGDSNDWYKALGTGDRERVVLGKRVDLGGRRIIKKKKKRKERERVQARKQSQKEKERREKERKRKLVQRSGEDVVWERTEISALQHVAMW